MDIKTALMEYKLLGEYFEPDYERDNEVLIRFKNANEILSDQQTLELIRILDNAEDRYFVADLLYLYDNFREDLFASMLQTGIYYKDPSFNRIFLRPCIMAFGVDKVAIYLQEQFNQLDVIGQLGLCNLLYWLSPKDSKAVENLYQTIIEKANNTTNLVELYYYKLCLGEKKINNSEAIPNNAVELLARVNGNIENEELLRKLGWRIEKILDLPTPKMTWLQKILGIK